MALEFKLAIQGRLSEYLKSEVEAGERAATKGVGRAAERAKLRLRDQVTGAGMGQRLANTWRANVYPSRDVSLNAAALVHSRAPTIVSAFSEGATIRSQKGYWLAIPTEAAPKNVSFIDPGSGDFKRNKRVTPRGVEQALGLKLRFVYRPGKPALLVADNARLGKTGKAKLASKRAIAKGHVTTVVMFILVPQVRLPKRFDLERVAKQAETELVQDVLAAWEEESRALR